MSTDKVDLGNHCIIRESANYLYTAFRICCRELQNVLVDAASINYNRMIGMVQERLHITITA